MQSRGFMLSLRINELVSQALPHFNARYLSKYLYKQRRHYLNPRALEFGAFNNIFTDVCSFFWFWVLVSLKSRNLQSALEACLKALCLSQFFFALSTDLLAEQTFVPYIEV